MKDVWVGFTDGQLWDSAGADPTAFGELFERHADSVYSHCFRRVGSWTAAEDLTSVVFLEAWRRRRDVRLSGDSILPWLLAVANNALRNRNRSLRRHRRLLAKLPAATLAPDPADDVADRVDDERRMTRVLVALNRLNVHEQDVLVLCVWDGLDYAAAAVALGVPVGTVRSRLSRARQHLRDLTASTASRPQPSPVIPPRNAAPSSPTAE